MSVSQSTIIGTIFLTFHVVQRLPAVDLQVQHVHISIILPTYQGSTCWDILPSYLPLTAFGCLVHLEVLLNETLDKYENIMYSNFVATGFETYPLLLTSPVPLKILQCRLPYFTLLYFRLRLFTIFIYSGTSLDTVTAFISNWFFLKEFDMRDVFFFFFFAHTVLNS